MQIPAIKYTLFVSNFTKKCICFSDFSSGLSIDSNTHVVQNLVYSEIVWTVFFISKWSPGV